MKSILWIFVACFTHQAIAGYSVQVDKIISNTKAVQVTNNVPNEGDIILTNTEFRQGSRFESKVSQDESEKGTIKGLVCDADSDDPAAALMVKIFYEAMGVSGCPFPPGSAQIKRQIQVDSNAFDQLLPPGFGTAMITSYVYAPNTDGKTAAFVWYMTVREDS